ncbi:MAG: alkylated DNA repair dioxygenase AlkB [Dokdonia donghaensis]|jgi:alkylated DNA repair dioxygenase AlkB|nr:2OG-Fe(II) oxygenase [uncultured bacterium]MDE0599807.1 alpha-ketoglutarate-dependent dioxygenase AlkB [Dokdonia donghaensis]
MSLFSSEPYNLDIPEGDITYYEDFLSKEEALHFYNTVYKETPWQQDDITVFGKTYAQPRLTALYGNNGKPYSYSNITMHPLEFTFALSEIKKRVEAITGIVFSTCLLNLYRDGNDSNGWHSDNEKELGKNPPIASVSLGATRAFKLRYKKDHSINKKLMLDSGSLLLMKGSTQECWQHTVPKTAKQVTPRINLTFRVVK